MCRHDFENTVQNSKLSRALLGAILSSVSGKALSSLQSFGLKKEKASMAEKHPSNPSNNNDKNGV